MTVIAAPAPVRRGRTPAARVAVPDRPGRRAASVQRAVGNAMLARHVESTRVLEQIPGGERRLVPQDIVGWMQIKANGTQTVAQAVEEVLERHPKLAGTLKLYWDNLGYWADRETLTDQDVDLAIGYMKTIPSLVNQVIASALAEGPTEDRTRLGFEIELGMMFTIDPQYVGEARRLGNHTLAQTDPPLLEFVVDDIRDAGKGATGQGEFRSVPLAPDRLGKQGGVNREAIKAAIGHFPPGTVFGTDELAKRFGAPWKHGDIRWTWTPTPSGAKLFPGLKSSMGRLALGSSRVAQHVTHSIPLTGFTQLGREAKELLIPGSGAVATVPDLLLFFVKRKIDVRDGTIVVETTGRNRLAPNPKSAIETIISLLDPREHEQALKALGPLPERVRVEKETGTLASTIPPATTVPDYPTTNPQGGRGFLSGEEKLKPVLVDFGRRDFRILIEHRGGNTDLIAAVNAAIDNDVRRLAPFAKAFAELDRVGDGVTPFSRWFDAR